MSYNMAEKILQDWANVQFETLVKEDATACLNDLFNGPLYLDPEGEPCDCFDEGAKRFNFSSACARISAALESISAVWVDIQAGEVLTSEPDWSAVEEFTHEDGSIERHECYWPEDYVHFDRNHVIRAIIGKELAKYIS